MRVAILGCGPAGLFAAHAATQAGHDVHLYSKPRKSFMRGAQYLHAPIPGLSGDPFEVDYRLEGTVEGYKNKVYGDLSDVLVSPETLVGKAQAWDIREAYDAAWNLYGEGVINFDAPHGLSRIEAEHDLTISTIPATLLCTDARHNFSSQTVWATDFVRYRGAFVRHEDGGMDDNVVICSGDPDDWWYRQSRIHGWENTEYPEDHKPKAEHVFEVVKPLSTDCKCHDNITRMGRYGKWRKGVLSHESYFDTLTIIATIAAGY